MSEATRERPAGFSTQRTSHRPLLVALGPTGGAQTLRAADAMATRTGSTLVVTSVVEPPPAYSFETRHTLVLPWLVEQQITERRESVHERLYRHGVLPGSGAEPHVEIRYGETVTTIAALAREFDAQLIVLGIGPQSARHRLLSAGTVWGTCQRTSRPVLAVAPQARELARVAVVGTDFSPESIAAARAALPLLAEGATMFVVHAWRRVDLAFPSGELARLNETYAASLPEQFDRFRSALGQRDGICIEPLALEGSPAELVLAVARAKGADLIVAGTHGRGMVERWLLGSTSSALLRAAECSVLLAPPPPVAERMALARHMEGTSLSRAPAAWDAELNAFVQRNQERATKLEIDDPTLGAQVQETGLVLVGATYDSHDRRVALMFGQRAGGASHFTRTLGDVRSLAVSSDARDVDRALFIESDGGGTLVTFLGD